MREASAVAAPTPMSRAGRAGDVGERMFAAEAGPVMMTEIRGVSNGRPERELGWQQSDPSSRQGSRRELAHAAARSWTRLARPCAMDKRGERDLYGWLRGGSCR
jgi:hypothetical protein